jgi:hypothetical protein
VTWEEAVAFALDLPGTELSTSYGKPAVKVAANGRAFLFPGHEADTSFGVSIHPDTIEMLKETEPKPSGRRPTMRAGPRCWYATRARTRSASAK